MKRIFLITALMLLSVASMNAQLDDKVRTHTIVALDKAGCSNILNNPNAQSIVKRLLLESSPIEDGRPLCGEGDLMSLVGFCTDPDQRNMTTYQFPIASEEQQYVYVENDGSNIQSIISNKWGYFANYSNPKCGHSDLFSLVSVAKPYALNELKKEGEIDDSFLTNRTFLILVTDHHYNGNDFYDEVHTLAASQLERGMRNVVDETKILPLCYAVEQEYFIKYIKTYNVGVRGYVELYEFLPLQTYLNLNSVADFPQKVRATRLRHRRYKVEVEFNHNGNEHYEVKKLEFAFKGEKSKDTSFVFTSADSVSFDYIVKRRVRPEYVNVRAWVRLNDGVYNTTVLTPSPDAPDHLGKKGLDIMLPIEYDKHARIFGVPMTDFMWPFGIKDQYKAALIVQTVLLALLPFMVLLGVWIFYRKNRYYTPGVEDITITPLKWDRNI